MSEMVIVEIDDQPTQVVTIEQEQVQAVIIEEDVQPVIEMASEGLRGPLGPPGPQGPAGPDLNTDLIDLKNLFENKLEYPGAVLP